MTKQYQQHVDARPDDLAVAEHPGADRRSLDLLDQQEQQVAAIERQEWQQVDESEIDAEQREEVPEPARPALRRVVADLADGGDPTEVLGADVTGHQLRVT